MHASIATLIFCCASFPNTLRAAAPPAESTAQIQYRAGMGFYLGKQGLKSPAEAATWFTRAAEQGHAKAQGMLGLCYHSGQGVPQDFQKAAHWLRRAADQDDAIAQHGLALLHANGQGVARDPATAVEWYLKAAKQDHAAAQTNLGAALESGTGVVQNLADAVYWYRRAAKQGFAPAQLYLGTVYCNGRGVDKDLAEGARWHQAAAEQGLAQAQFLSGTHYFFGEGVPQDFVQAHKWMNLAAASSHTAAAEHLRTVADKMTPQQLGEAQRLAALFAARRTGGATVETPAHPSSDATAGTGFFITAEGYVLTSQHVVAGAKRIEVITAAGVAQAKLIEADIPNDIALLKIDGRHTPLTLSPSNATRLGHAVFTIGFPNTAMQGVEPKYSAGFINGLGGVQDDPHQFQINAAVQPGNSGGALVDEGGRAIGMIQCRLNPLKTFQQTGSLPQQVNYALKSDVLLTFIRAQPVLAGKLAPPLAKVLSKEESVAAAQAATVRIQAHR